MDAYNSSRYLLSLIFGFLSFPIGQLLTHRTSIGRPIAYVIRSSIRSLVSLALPQLLLRLYAHQTEVRLHTYIRLFVLSLTLVT